MSSLEVHFDLLDLTELTDMSDQELAEVFADSDEDIHNESPAGKGMTTNVLLKNEGNESLFLPTVFTHLNSYECKQKLN